MILDSLTITHSNGRVSRITEKAPTNLLTGTFEIVQNGRHSYYYDNAGSLTRDVLRNITIHNDINGNPDFITFGGGSEIESGYTTGGQKLWTVHRTAAGFIPSDVLSDPNKPKPTPEIGNTPSQYSRLSDYLIQNVGVTRYYDGYEFYDRNLTEGKFYFSNGYVSFHSDGSFDYSAIITDYRGSTRVVMTFDSTLSTSNIVHANSYYPSGALVTDVQTSFQLGSTSGGVQTHKFLGKELDRMYGLDWYDLGVRRYDAAAETFWSMDPLCEKYYHINPYAYCAGDPVNYVDPDGRDWYELYDNDTNEKTISWTDYHSQEDMNKGGINGRYLGPAVVVFNGSRSERLGKGNVLGAEGGVYAQVSVYGLNENEIDHSLIGYTMTSNAEIHTPIDEGEYQISRRVWKGEGKIPKYYMVWSDFSQKDDKIRTMDGVKNKDYPEQVFLSTNEGYKSEIRIHTTLSDNNVVGSQTSTGCLLLEWESYIKFDNLLKSVRTDISFPLILNRSK